MFDRRVLLLATYPIAQPRDGGQKRVTAIVKEYRKHFKSVKFVGIFKGRYPAYTRTDIYVKSDGGVDRGLVPFVGDVVAGEAIFKDKRVRKRLTKVLLSFQPDIIEMEQPFVYLGLKSLLESLKLHPKLVLNSQNVEYSMKEEILKGIGADASVTKAIVSKIKAIEQAAAQDADIVIAVSEADSRDHLAMGAKKCVVALNGIEKVRPSPAAVRHWQDYMASHYIRHAVAFIGSAHPPNWAGFLQMVSDRMGFLPPDTRLFLAGSISDYFVQNFQEGNVEHTTFWQRVIPTGRLTDDRLAGLIHQAEVLILPITEGGGSNLKTAEAILSGRKVVATSYAFRAFEAYAKLPNIYIADTPGEFRAAIIAAINSPYQPRTDTEERLAERVQWEYSLEAAVKAVSKL